VTIQPIDYNEELPLLTEVVGDPATDSLPILTEVVTDNAPAGESALPSTLSSDEMMLLLARLEVHLETVFTSKLNKQLEQLQRLAVDLAVSEFKAELPQLLHDAINKADVSR
jgi:hypothetical protein